MRNLSLAKLLGFFGGFLLVILVLAVVIVKATRTGTTQPVTTKVYHPDEKLDMPVETPPVDPQGVAVAVQNVIPAPALSTKPGAMSPAAIAAAPPAIDPGPGNPPLEVGAPSEAASHLMSLDSQFDNLSARVSALEAKVAARSNSPRNSVPRVRAAAVQQPTDEQREQSLSQLADYKSMAVVGDRAWVRTADGVEDSASPGERLPGLRVRTIHRDTSVIITSTDQRIDPN
jgi:hypothetical protein